MIYLAFFKSLITTIKPIFFRFFSIIKYLILALLAILLYLLVGRVGAIHINDLSPKEDSNNVPDDRRIDWSEYSTTGEVKYVSQFSSSMRPIGMKKHFGRREIFFPFHKIDRSHKGNIVIHNSSGIFSFLYPSKKVFYNKIRYFDLPGYALLREENKINENTFGGYIVSNYIFPDQIFFIDSSYFIFYDLLEKKVYGFSEFSKDIPQNFYSAKTMPYLISANLHLVYIMEGVEEIYYSGNSWIPYNKQVSNHWTATGANLQKTNKNEYINISRKFRTVVPNKDENGDFKDDGGSVVTASPTGSGYLSMPMLDYKQCTINYNVALDMGKELYKCNQESKQLSGYNNNISPAHKIANNVLASPSYVGQTGGDLPQGFLLYGSFPNGYNNWEGIDQTPSCIEYMNTMTTFFNEHITRPDRLKYYLGVQKSMPNEEAWNMWMDIFSFSTSYAKNYDNNFDLSSQKYCQGAKDNISNYMDYKKEYVDKEFISTVKKIVEDGINAIQNDFNPIVDFIKKYYSFEKYKNLGIEMPNMCKTNGHQFANVFFYLLYIFLVFFFFRFYFK